MKTLYLPKLLIKDSNLTLSQKKVAYYLFHVSLFEEIHLLPSARQLAKKLNMDHKTILKACSILEGYDYLEINQDSIFNFKINGISFRNSDFKSRLANNMAEHFVVVPTNILYYPDITPSELDTYIKFFDRNFKIVGDKFKLKNNSITTANIVAQEWGCDERTMQQNLQSLKEKGLIDYTAVSNINCYGGHGKKYVSFKFFTMEQTWIVHNGRTVTKENAVIKTTEKTYEEEIVKEDVVEEKTIEYLSKDEIEEITPTIRPELLSKWKTIISKKFSKEDALIWAEKNRI